MQKSDLTELEIEVKDLKLRLARPGSNQGSVSHREVMVPPMVGTFYRRPSPEDPEFVKVGDKIKKGDVLCIIEAMKVMNEIQSDVSGELLEILVEDGVSVEFGQALYKIRPS